jgi:hypothetical protein
MLSWDPLSKELSMRVKLKEEKKLTAEQFLVDQTPWPAGVYAARLEGSGWNSRYIKVDHDTGEYIYTGAWPDRRIFPGDWIVRRHQIDFVGLEDIVPNHIFLDRYEIINESA